MDIGNFKSPSPKFKSFYFSFFLLPFALLLLSSCVSFQVTGEIQKGRMALLRGDSANALVHFERASKLDPDYNLNFSILDQGVWTYVGRAYYSLGRFPEARQALEQARSRHDYDHLAKLYLGLTLAQNGDRQRGLQEIESGLIGLQRWIAHIHRYHPDGTFWDPNGRLRAKIDEGLAMIQGREMAWPELIADGEWLGKEFEEEVDLFKQDRSFDLRHDGDNDSGGVG